MLNVHHLGMRNKILEAEKLSNDVKHQQINHEEEVERTSVFVDETRVLRTSDKVSVLESFHGSPESKRYCSFDFCIQYFHL